MKRPVVGVCRITVNGREFTVFKKRVKNLTLRLKRTGCEVTSPVHASEERVRSFIEKHASWIEKHAERAEDNAGKVWLFGVPYERREEESAKPYVVFSGGVCRIGGKDAKEREKALLDHYKQALSPVLTAFFEKWEKITSLSVRSVSITSATTYYGRCDVKKRTVRISCRLAAKPHGVIDYVVLHELCHLKVCGHQSDFYALVEKYMPDYRERVKLMKRSGGAA